MQAPKPQAFSFPVGWLFVIGFGLLLVLKLALASILDLYSDEIFYWQESTHPALAYSDLPFVTAQLVSLGAMLQPGSTLAVRSLFLLLGSLLPLLVYWIALPVTNRQQALESATLTLCLPLAGFLGLLAVPDVPLLILGAFALGLFERALRTDQLRYWLATGVIVALGFSTHYRFFLYPLAALLYLGLFKPARRHWRNPGLWVALFIACVGLIPIIWFNFGNDLSSASFYLVERHPWDFQPAGLLHIFKQAGLVTPLLYGVFLLTLITLVSRARAGNATAALFVSFALTNLLTYLLLAPWTDATSTSIHWPLSGYLPLLIFVPETLRTVYQFCARRWTTHAARRLTLTIPALGFTGTLVALLGVGSQAFQEELQPLIGRDILSTKMAGWEEFSGHTRTLIAERFTTGTPLIVTDNYYTAAQIEFAGVATPVYTLDEEKAVSDGRRAQLRLWGRDESGLQAIRDRSLLFITEDSTLDIPGKLAMLTRFCQLTEQVEQIGELALFGGDKRYSYYRAQRRADYSLTPGYRYQPCPYPAQGWIDSPQDGARLGGKITVAGWAFNEDIGVAEVYLMIDDERFARLNYGQPRADVVTVMGVATDPMAPALGFEYELDTARLERGHHTLAIDIVNRLGNVTHYRSRDIFIEEQ